MILDHQSQRESDARHLRANGFSPRLWSEPGVGWCYEDGCVTASVSVTPDGFTPKAIGIHEWSSSETGKGHTTHALQWFRAQGFERIEAHSVGMIDDVDGELVGDISTYYWAHMYCKGLCDALYDDEGAELEVIHGDPAIGPEIRHKAALPPVKQVDELIQEARRNDKDLDTHGPLAEFLEDMPPSDRSAVVILWAAESHSINELQVALDDWSEESPDRRREVLSAAMNLAADHNDLIRGRMSDVANGHVIGVCKALLSAGADPSRQGEDGLTVLHRATVNSNLGIMGLMLDAGCPIEVLSKHGDTPLRTSIESSCYMACRYLLQRGADTEAMLMKNGQVVEDAMSPVDLAEYRLSSSQTWLLIAYGAKKSDSLLQDTRFMHATPAFAAMKAGDVERMIGLLSTAGEEGLKEVPVIRKSLEETMHSMDDQYEADCREMLCALDAFSAKSLMASISDRGRRSRAAPS